MTVKQKRSDRIRDLALKMRQEFARLDFKPPAAIVLGSHEDGMRLLSAFRDEPTFVYTQPNESIKPVEHPDGSVWMELEIYGIKFHWPAKPYAITKGGYVFT